MQSKERETLDAPELDVNSPYHLGPSDSYSSELEKEQQEDKESEDFNKSTWEERYEKIWVESEKKETKSQYKNVTAELKERFGEVEWNEVCESACRVEMEGGEEQEEIIKEMMAGTEVPEGASEQDSSDDDEEPIVPPAPLARTKLLPIPEQRESGLEDSCSGELKEELYHIASDEDSEVDLPLDDPIRARDTQQMCPELPKEAKNSDEGSGLNINPPANVSEYKENSDLANTRDVGPELPNQEFSDEARGMLFVCDLGIPPSESPNSDEEVKEDLQMCMAEVGHGELHAWIKQRKMQL